MREDDGIPKVLVLLTDGRSQGDPVGPAADELKKIGISIFGIGVGSRISMSQLNEIASDPDSEYVFRRTFDNLIADWVDRLSTVSCSGKCRFHRNPGVGFCVTGLRRIRLIIFVGLRYKYISTFFLHQTANL